MTQEKKPTEAALPSVPTWTYAISEKQTQERDAKPIVYSSFLVMLSNGLNAITGVALVLIVSHLGEYKDAAKLGLAIGAISPIQLFLSMQLASFILVGSFA